MGVINDNDKDNKEKKPEFNTRAYKHAIGMIESSGGKLLDNPNSSAAGRYHFLYNSIKNDPDMKGVSKREFMNRADLQELIMDKALNGTLAGYTYGSGYAKRLKDEYKTDHDINDLTALIHFLGAGNVRKYLKDPNNFKVPGAKNATAQQYVDRFRKHFDSFVGQGNAPMEDDVPSIAKTDERFQNQKVQDGTSVKQPVRKQIIPKQVNLRERAEASRGNSSLEFLTNEKGANNFNYGGDMKTQSGADELVTLFKNGGSHKENLNGGIPQGIGPNGKVNLVEEGETKWNDYIFSNAISLDGTITSEEGNVSNVFENGGSLDPTDKDKEKTAESKNNTPVYGPQQTEASKYPLRYTKTESKFHRTGLDTEVKDTRADHLKPTNYVELDPKEKVDFESLAKTPGAKQFLARYNDPITRQRLKEQATLTDYDIDNHILAGLGAGYQVGSNVPGSKASYDYDSNKISMGEDHVHDEGVESHERVHASQLDQAMAGKLNEVLGNSFHQEGRSFLKKMSPDTLRYLNRPHEAYGNFSEFREKIGLKPGEQIDVKELKKRVKAKGLDMENFYRAFSDDNIIEALNTVAFQDNSNNEYKLA